MILAAGNVQQVFPPWRPPVLPDPLTEEEIKVFKEIFKEFDGAVIQESGGHIYASHPKGKIQPALLYGCEYGYVFKQFPASGNEKDQVSDGMSQLSYAKDDVEDNRTKYYVFTEPTDLYGIVGLEEDDSK